MSISIERFARAKFNTFRMSVREEVLKDRHQPEELLQFLEAICRLFTVNYGFIAHIIQERRQSPILTPAERLPGVFWANFFGPPYIDFFGREKLLATPCHEVTEIGNDLILLLTAGSPRDPSMLENDEATNRVKSYLNQNAFAGPNFPDEPCSVPVFDFSDVRRAVPELPELSSKEKILQFRAELAAKGHEVIDEIDGRVRFRTADGLIGVFDSETGTLSIDTTGGVLSN